MSISLQPVSIDFTPYHIVRQNLNAEAETMQLAFPPEDVEIITPH